MGRRTVESARGAGDIAFNARRRTAHDEREDGRLSNNPFETGYGAQGGGYTMSMGDARPAPAPAPAPGGGAGTAGSGAATIVDTTTQSFADDVLKASLEQLVLVDFWAAWCGPCKQLTPVIEKVVNAYGGAVKLAKMDVDAHPAIPGQLGVQSLPTVLAFAQGRPLDGFMGALPESQIKQFVEQCLAASGMPSEAPGGLPVEELLAEAKAALEAGDVARASELYVAILSEDPESVPAVAGLAQVRLAGGDAEGARGMVEQLPEAKRGAPEVAAVLAKLDLLEKSAGLGDAGDLAATVEANPDDHQARFDLALATEARGDRAGAAEQLLAIVRKDREWNEDGARKQLITFFDAWGPTDPATLKARRQLASLMFG